MEPRNLESLYPLSPAQKGILFHSLYAATPGTYFCQAAFTLRTRLDVDAFERAWRRVVERHAVLRSSYHWEEVEKPLQVVYRQVDFAVERGDVRALPEAEQLRAEAEAMEA